MKTRKIFSFLLFITLIFVLASCKWAGGDSFKESPGYCNNQGRLVKKLYSSFDKKFGYETMVNLDPSDSTSLLKKVFIPAKTWARIPTPNDTTVVYIEYIENIEYGYNGFLSFWDNQFNLCTGFTVEQIESK